MAGARTDAWTIQIQFPALRGTRPSGPAPLHAGPSLLGTLGSHTVPLFWASIKPSVRPTGTTGTATESLLKEMSEQWYKKPGPKYSLAIPRPAQGLTDTSNGQPTSMWLENDGLRLPDILGRSIIRWHGGAERSAGRGHVIWVLIPGTEVWPYLTSQWDSLHLFLLTPGTSPSLLFFKKKNIIYCSFFKYRGVRADTCIFKTQLTFYSLFLLTLDFFKNKFNITIGCSIPL